VEGTNVHYILASRVSDELKVDQSVAHNGVCLTVVEVGSGTHKVTAVAETLAKTNLAKWHPGDEVNIERSLRVGDRIDGHFVQGHVDATVECISKKSMDGSWLYSFRFSPEFAPLVIEKGSICLNGVSLTVFDVKREECTVTIIPYTYEHTNFQSVGAGSILNVEFDVLGKYLQRRESLNLQG
jgi:riboflavin synthase